nr:DNA helicase [Tanacetum cinerariifolium]
MIAILEKYEHNVDFHPIMDFVEASHIRYALTINPNVYVSHIRQFWSTTRIETTDERTKILATVDGKPRTISKSSIRRNLKLNDEAGISSLPDAELFENLALIGYNILPNQKFSFQKGFNEFSSNIATAVTVPLFDSMLVHQGEGSGTPTEPHHTPSPEVPQSPQHDLSSSIHPPITTKTIPTITHTEIPTLRQYSRRARIAQSSALPTTADEPASPLVDDSQGEACPTVSGLEAGQDRANIIKSSTLPHDSTPRVTSLAANKGSMQHKLQEFTDLFTHLQRQQTEIASKIAAQDLEITSLKARIKLLQDKDEGGDEPSGEDATIKERSLEIGEEAAVKKSTERGSNDTEELVKYLTSLDAASILTSGVQVVSVPPAAEVATISVPTGSGLVPTASPIFTIASVVTPYSRQKGKEKMVESDTPKKKKLQEQIDVQVAREMEEQLAREDQRMDEQIERDAEIARIHAEEELHMLIDSLDRNNEMIAKYLQEYEQFAEDLSIRERIELINDLVKYQDNYAKVIKYQSQQRKPLSKKQQREFYMSVLKSHSGWKTKHFKGMSLEEIRENFILVWKQIEDFVSMGSKKEGERVKRKGLRLEQDSSKKVKTSEEVSEEDLKTMMQLVLVKEVYVEALQVKYLIIDWEIHTEGQRTYWKIIRLEGNTAVYQFFVDMLKHFDREDLNQLWTLVKETLSIRQATSDKEKELWVDLKRLYEPDVEDQLWTQTQALMQDPVEWRLYDTCGVHHVLSRDQEIFIDEFPLPEDFPTASEERFPLLSQKDATAEEVCTADEVKHGWRAWIRAINFRKPGFYPELTLKPQDGSGKGKKYLDVTPADRADIVCRVFEQKVKAFVNFLKEVQTFCYLIVVLYTIEFQQRGLPHCHTLLWVNSKDKIKDAEQIDEYISAEIPDPVEDPRGHKLVTELMMHGPCCGANLSASCMQNVPYNKNFPKKYNLKTFFDSNGHTHYQRRDTRVHVMKGESRLDNCDVVPYNQALCLEFEAHTNVEYYGWSMLIKCLFKYIPKGSDRILAKISKTIREAFTSAAGNNIQIDKI